MSFFSSKLRGQLVKETERRVALEVELAQTHANYLQASVGALCLGKMTVALSVPACLYPNLPNVPACLYPNLLYSNLPYVPACLYPNLPYVPIP